VILTVHGLLNDLLGDLDTEIHDLVADLLHRLNLLSGNLVPCLGNEAFRLFPSITLQLDTQGRGPIPGFVQESLGVLMGRLELLRALLMQFLRLATLGLRRLDVVPDPLFAIGDHLHDRTPRELGQNRQQKDEDNDRPEIERPVTDLQRVERFVVREQERRMTKRTADGMNHGFHAVLPGIGHDRVTDVGTGGLLR